MGAPEKHGLDALHGLLKMPCPQKSAPLPVLNTGDAKAGISQLSRKTPIQKGKPIKFYEM